MPNHDVARAMRLFEQVEGIDIDPAAGVALAGLAAMVGRGEVARDATVLLNVTGGGRVRRSRDMQLKAATPDLWIDVADVRERSLLAATATRVADAVGSWSFA